MKLTPDEKFERALDAKHRRRLRAEDRFLAKREKQEAAADAKIGELVRDGKTVYYIAFGAAPATSTSFILPQIGGV